MLSLLDDDRYIEEKNTLISRIKKSCSRIKNPSILDNEFIQQVVYFILINPDNGFATEEIQQEFLDRLFDACCNFIRQENSPHMTILKLRRDFKMVFQQDDWAPEDICSFILNDHISDVESRLESLIKAIINEKHTNDKKILNSVYNKIVFYIILNSGLGTPDKSKVVNETRAALSSVFHFYAIKPFLKKTDEEKREQLAKLTNIVIGIRLFYWHFGEYGEGVENIPDALVKGLNKSIHDLANRVTTIEQHVKEFTGALWQHYKIIDLKKTHKHNNLNPIENNFHTDDLDDVKYIKHTINILHQYITFLRDILNVLKYAQQDVNRTIDEFHEALMDLQKYTKYKNKYIVTEYVPTDVVVQKFTNVAFLWKTLWKYVVSVHLLNDLEDRLNLTVDEMKLSSPDLLSHFTESTRESDEERHHQDKQIDEKNIGNAECKLVDDSADTPLRIQGFSLPILFLEGFLVLGDPKLGVIQYKNGFYAFTSAEDGYLFCENKDTYLQKLPNSLRQYPELIDFLKMRDSLYHEQNVPIETKKYESGIQTELHPVKHFIDKNYHFNAYELMRRRWKKTHSYLNCENKSTKTCFLVDESTQTFDTRTASTQESDKSTGVSRPLIYIYGLRGFNNDSIVQDADYVPLLNLQL